MHRHARGALGVTCAFYMGCGAADGATPRSSSPERRATEPARVDGAWPTATQSPGRASPHAGIEATFADACGPTDVALDEVAAQLADRRSRSLPTPESDEVAELLRAAGEPHVWPRTFVASGPSGRVLPAFRVWRAATRSVGEARCGVAVRGDVVAVVLVNALADLAPLPIRAHAGEWLTVDASLLVAAHHAEVVVLGPLGAPRTVPSSLDGPRLRARFAPDTQGAFLVQVLADVDRGPRPVLEARVFADVDPAPLAAAAPGERAAPSPDPKDTLDAMLEAARADEHLAPLARDAELDALALAHTNRMYSTRTVGHDVGDGDPAMRLSAANYPASEVGENAARASSLPLAHRALWSSPSHRTNMLSPRFTRVGLAVVTSDDGTTWVTELFAR